MAQPPVQYADHWLPSALVVAILAWVLWINGPAIRLAGHEVGDLAANSLLVLDAKKLELLVGNYSRLGFNHPGPALLYVLAAGETVFHDLFGMTAAPIGGQLLAACLLSALWLALVARMTTTILGGSSLEGIAATCLFAAFLVQMEPQSLGALWFPYLYILPFGVLTLSLARLAAGSTRELCIVALSGGTLVHGHVSFASLGAVMIAAAFAIRAVIASRAQGGTRIVAVVRGTPDQERRRMAVAGVVTAAFAAPIVANTILNFPGDAAAYLVFGREPKGHSAYEAVRFVAESWGGWYGAAFGSLVLAAMASRAGTGPTVVAWMVLATTLGVFLYARFGIDDLSHSYTVLFYSASIAITLSFAVTLGIRRITAHRLGLAAVVVISLLAIVVLARPAEIATRSDVAEMATALVSPPARKVRLDLDDSYDWPGVWSAAAGTAVELRRAGYDGLCIGENWHILFTRRLACNRGSSPDSTFRLNSAAPGAGLPEPSLTFGELRLTRQAQP